MKIKQWIDDHMVTIVVLVVFILTALAFIWLGMNIQYCIDHPGCDWCKATNSTGIINLEVW